MNATRSRQVLCRKVFDRPLVKYAFAAAMVAVALALRALLIPITGMADPYGLFLGAVLVTSLFAGYRAGIVAAALSIVVGTLGFVLPVDYPRAQMVSLVLLTTADCAIVLFLSYLALRDRGIAEQLLAAEQQTREQAEASAARLRESEERFRLTTEEAPIGMALVALDGTFQRANRAFCELVGYSESELQQHHFADITHPADLEIGIGFIEVLKRGDIPRLHIEKRYIRKDGGVVVALLNVSVLRALDGTPLHFISQIVDITEQKRVEREQRLLAKAGALLSASLDYEATLTNVGELVARAMANWCIIEIAESETRPRRLRVVPEDPKLHSIVEGLERLNLDPNQPHLAKHVWDTRQPVVYEQLSPADLDAFAQNPEHLRLLQAIEPRSVLGVPLVARGHTLGALLFVSSVSDRMFTRADIPFAAALGDRAALAIENGRHYQAAVEATQLRDQVLAVVAHDLRNPLAVINFAATAQQPKPGEPERRNQKWTQAIIRATNRMNRLIQDLLDITRIEAGTLTIDRRPISPRHVLAECLDVQHALVTSASLSLHLDAEDELPEILADHDRLLQVLENLIGNAIKFTPRGGNITVAAMSRRSDVMFSVADTGRGISTEAQGHVFDRFWQVATGSRSGAGLGLPITRGIVEAHDGEIWVESEVGRGSTFYFTIPRARGVELPGPEYRPSYQPSA